MKDFQSYASKDGEHYRVVCCESLERYGFEVLHPKGLRIADCGVDVDIVARNLRGLEFLIECKGGYERGAKKGGFRSSDNVRKAIASARCLWSSETHKGYPFTPLLSMTTYMADVKSVNFVQLSVIRTDEMLDIVNDRDAARLKMWARADYSFVQGHIAQYPFVTWVAMENRFWNLPVLAMAAD